MNQFQPIGKICLLLAMTISFNCGRKALADSELGNNRTSLLRQQALQPFTVADSIAMTHFEVPAEGAPSDAPISPAGTKFFVVTERGILEKNLREYTLLVYNLNGPAGKPLVVAHFDSSSNRPGISQAEWLDNGHIALLGEVAGGTPQLYIVDCETGRQRQLTKTRQGVLSYALSTDQKKLVYYELWGREQPDDKYREEHGFAVGDELLADLVNGGWRRHELVCQLHIKDLLTGKVRVLPRQNASRRTPAIWLSPNGRYAITEQVPDSVPVSWTSYEDPFVKRYAQEWLANKSHRVELAETMLVDTVTGSIRQLIDAPSSVGRALTSVVWSSDSRSAIVASTLLPLNTDDEAELAKRRAHSVIAAIDVANGAVQRIIDMPTDAWLEVERGSGRNSFLIAGWKEDAGGSFLSGIATRSFHREATGWVEDKTQSRRPELAEITIRQALDHWPVLVRVDRATQRETLILDPNPQFQHFRFGRREVINWTGKLGEPLTGGLVYPVDYLHGTRYPLVIQTHGFSAHEFLLDGPFTTAMAAEELANKGIAVLQLPQSDLEEANVCHRGPATQSQLESAVDYLDSIGLIDRNRVGLVGFSITGFNVRHALVNSTYHFAAATSAEGNDWGYWTYVVGGNWGAWMSQAECAYGGPPWNNNWDPWLKNSISFHYDSIKTPLRLESDSNDVAEVLNEWENFIALKRLHKPVELVYVSHGDHPVVKPWDRLTSQQGNVDWMVFWLKGEEDPDPSKAEQYAKWHVLKKLQDTQISK
jgi:dipeptidyl aminopeptidase/acylaminoacyl peptidase